MPRITRAVRASNLTTTQRAVLVISLASRASSDGVAWPAVSTVAADTALGRRAVIYALQELEALGVITRCPSPQRSSAFRIRVDRISAVTPGEVDAAREAVRGAVVHEVHPESGEEGCTTCAGSVHDVQIVGAPDAPDQPIDRSKDQPNPHSENGEEGTDPKVSGLASAVSTVWASYRALHPRSGKTPPASERRLIEARLREVKKDEKSWEASAAIVVDVIEAHHKAAEAAWFQGDNPRGKAFLGIETLCKPTGWASRCELASQWRDAGRPVAVRVVPGGQASADKAWAYLEELTRRGARDLPPDLEEKVGKAKAGAFRHALTEIGGFGAFGRLHRSQEKDARALFTSAYVAELGRRSS